MIGGVGHQGSQAAARDPRRAPRVAACCSVEILADGEIWTGATEDVGPGGCLLFTRELPATGSELVLSLSSDLVEAPLVAAGRIAWARRTSVTRAGIAFSAEPGDARRSPAEWFRRLLSALPLAARATAPRLDARVFLGRPPSSHADLAPEELRLLRRIAGGASVGGLVATEGEPLVFRALGCGIASLAPTPPGAVARWAQVFADATPQIAARSSPRACAAAAPHRLDRR